MAKKEVPSDEMTTTSDDAPAPKGRSKKEKEPKGPDPIDELSANWEDAETKELLTRQLAKEVLSKGSWATIMFLVQDLDRKSKAYRAPKISVRRYKKSGGSYRYQSSFNISSEKQAREMMVIINKWFASDGPGRKAAEEVGEAAGNDDE
ncbi:MAG: hypothetical protein HY904_05160 [Deltaproteobacteria bacterium]|nr:hypothetical protein [Deltaproteobacteria bacterium]